MRFDALLAAVRRLALLAQAHQDLPFEQLVEALQPERSLGHNPLFQVMLNHEQHELSGFTRLGDLKVEPFALPVPAAKVDLSLDTAEHPDGTLSATFTYAADILDRATAEHLLASFAHLLTRIGREPARPIREYELLSPSGHSLLPAWNATEAPIAEPLRLHRQIEAQVLATPSAPAVVFGTEVLSYGELNARANRLAHRLRALGVGPDTLVGIAAHRSLEMVVGLLAILKAGGAYVPLDPDYPAERLAFMLEDSGVGLLLTQEHLLPLLPATAAQVICLDRDQEGPAEDPADQGTGQDLVYCLYTSGTTGRPKGAGNTHAALCNRLQWMQREYRLTPADRVLQKTPFSFDVSAWELFWPLMAGAVLVMAPPGAHRDPAALRRLIVDRGVTVLHFVPSMLQAFMAVEEISACTSLRAVVCSGEALGAELAQRFLASSRAGLHNLYGPTEAAIDVSHWACRVEEGRTAVPIGRPIANIRLHVLDRHLCPVPVGVPGELYHRRDRAGARLPSPAGPHRRALRAGPVRDR